jgi:hypothetical protein
METDDFADSARVFENGDPLAADGRIDNVLTWYFR